MFIADRKFLEAESLKRLPPDTESERTEPTGLCPLLSDDIGNYPDGIIVPVNKPYRWTSADVIRKIKFTAARHFRKKNLKVGHAGTLDPLATGVLLVCIGNATKKAEEMQSHDKEYIAGITFGATTPSYDLEKAIDRMYPYGHVTEEAVRKALPDFIGEQEQIAPLFSAKSVDGVRAYEMARKLYRERLSTPGMPGINPAAGTAVAMDTAAEGLIRASRINISDISLLEFHPEGKTPAPEAADANARQAGAGLSTSEEHTGRHTGEDRRNLRINVTDNSRLHLPEALIRITCSKGTYIRAFARDLGEFLGTGAHLSSLIRSRSGGFRVEDSLDINEAMSLFSGIKTDINN